MNTKGCPQMVKIKKVVQENPFVKTFYLDISLGAKPGQFVNIWLPRIDEKPFSVSYDDGKELQITFFAIGPMSKALFEKKEGDLVGIRGPYGTHYEWEKGDHLMLLAGGYGAAPMFFVAKEAQKDGCKIDFIVGARSKDYLLYLDRIATISGVNLHIATDDGSAGIKGYNTVLFEQLIGQTKPDRVFGCGPEGMEFRIVQICQQNNLQGWLSVERYMKCGFGVCGHCCMDTLGVRACKEGPVMSVELLFQLPEFGNYHRDKVGRKVSWGK